mgnify:CR=1 FL=1
MKSNGIEECIETKTPGISITFWTFSYGNETGIHLRIILENSSKLKPEWSEVICSKCPYEEIVSTQRKEAGVCVPGFFTFKYILLLFQDCYGFSSFNRHCAENNIPNWRGNSKCFIVLLIMVNIVMSPPKVKTSRSRFAVNHPMDRDVNQVTD